MDFGISFPSMEISGPEAVKEFVQGAEELGFSQLTTLEHTLSVRISANYSPDQAIHEPMVLFGFMAAVTSRIRLTNSILILPQRQAVVVARQAAEIDVLSGGRMQVGIGIGSNADEAAGMGTDFHTRGARVDEQIELMRLLWTQDVVNYQGRYHKVTHAGINPLPVQKPIPIWIGGGAPKVVERIGRLADGWFPQFQPDSAGQEQIAQMREFAKAAGRDPSAIGIEGRVSFGDGNPDTWNKAAAAWDEAGATHLSVNTMRAGLQGPDQHIDAIRRFKEAVSG